MCEHPPILNPLTCDIKELTEACTEWGMFYCAYENINPSDVFTHMKEYFAQPLPTKNIEQIPTSLTYQIASYKNKPKIGYANFKTKETYSYAQGNNNKIYDQYCKLMSEFAHKIYNRLTMSANSEFYETLSLLHYYYDNKQTISLNEHKDWGYLTFLTTDASGLQVFHKEKWIDINPIDNHYIVNIGNTMEYLYNYHSPLHRVINANCDKYSIAFFYEPHPTTILNKNNNQITYYDFLTKSYCNNL